MSNNLRLEVLLNAVGRAIRPLKSIQTASNTLSDEMRNTQKRLRDLNNQASKIDGFRKSNTQLAATGRALDKAKREAGELAVQFKNTTSPTRAQAQAFEAAKRSASELKAKYNDLRVSIQRQRSELKQAGINTRTLFADERRLKTSIGERTAQLNQQRGALARVGAQQAKLNKVKERYQAGKALAGNMAAAGAVGERFANAGVMAGVKLLMPGYEFTQKNSELQAMLGVGKQSLEMQALRKQARQLGDNTAASAGDAVSAQMIVAKRGGDVDAIAAMTPVILNLSLANKKNLEENAQLLMGTKAAFQLSNDAAAHIGDVLSTTMDKTTADFQGLSDSLSYLAPVAKDAGLSLEQAAAISGTLHDNNIRGAMAGAGGAAVVTRLQAPTGEVYDALKALGVKPTDSKGDFRPLFDILKEIQASFKGNNLGAGQQAEYMKTIFGEQASSSAGVLMAAAASGKLDELAATIKASDGKTEALIRVMQDNLGGDFSALQSAYEAVGTEIFDQQEGSLRKLTQTATQYVLKIGGWIKDNKELAQTIGIIAGGALVLAGILGGLGLVVLPVVTGINAIIAAASMLGIVFGAITWPIAVLGAVLVAGALLIYQFWEPISALFAGVGESINESFTKFIKEKYARFKALFSSDKSTQVKEESNSIDTETAKAPLVGQGGGYTPTIGLPGGYQAYQPVTAPAGRSYIDQSSPTYQINLPGGGATGGQLGYQLQDALEKYERDKRAKARASMMHD
ncbi:phage tail tape measure protein [Enterobacteriaceae bacterium YMB-R22]|jgi:TP901 family phage tail tape measure protein|uniref:phage tail tape measure protein n=1 Tax=Tenebrionicola larvae TaxID=2815733 RepID=UPI002011C181|nr:phage tail tape measure protein [Tenebrionicola larvae]MBV4412886.1 phage tail tape measure protein [Tenebrionicola larvae]